MEELGYYIKVCTGRFHEKCHKFLDCIYGADDIEQMIHIHLWEYMGRYDIKKSCLKTYVVNNMKQVYNRVLYISQMEKRDPKKASSLDDISYNEQGDQCTLIESIPDYSWKKKTDKDLEEFFNKAVLGAINERIYQMIKQGYTMREIAKIFKVSHQRIQQMARAIGIKLEKKEYACRKIY
jgi:RNA polymerase sigma factor (sigma-70 family)